MCSSIICRAANLSTRFSLHILCIILHIIPSDHSGRYSVPVRMHSHRLTHIKIDFVSVLKSVVDGRAMSANASSWGVGGSVEFNKAKLTYFSSPLPFYLFSVAAAGSSSKQQRIEKRGRQERRSSPARRRFFIQFLQNAKVLTVCC